MAKIAYILLCHKDPDAIIEQARRLTAAGDFLSIHFDASAARKDYEQITNALADLPLVTFTKRRVRCGWGEWSLVQATLNALETAVSAFPQATHFYMLSGDCMPIKSADYVHRYLSENDADFIESVDYFNSNWIKTGWKEERLTYRHWFNERSQPRLFYGMFELQKRLGLARKIPADLDMMIGSQWWCLRRLTVERLLEFCHERPDILRFFRTTWIPDETFFQTLVRHLIPKSEIRSRTLTFLMFTDYGMPLVFYNDHYELLKNQDYLFARKISPEAQELKERLGALYTAQDEEFQISNEGAGLFRFLTERGREGRRFAPRFWEAEATLGGERALMIVICKKWHVAKRLLDQIRQISNVPAIEYLFNEESTHLPDLGGIQSTLAKRTRHRRALMRMLFDYYETDRLIICLDPSNIDLMDDFANDRAQTRFLEIQCRFSDDYLVGHARRVGLAADHTSAETLDRLLPTIRRDIAHESERIRDAGYAHLYRMKPNASASENAGQLAKFLDIEELKVQNIASAGHLFSD